MHRYVHALALVATVSLVACDKGGGTATEPPDEPLEITFQADQSQYMPTSLVTLTTTGGRLTEGTYDVTLDGEPFEVVVVGTDTAIFRLPMIEPGAVELSLETDEFIASGSFTVLEPPVIDDPDVVIGESVDALVADVEAATARIQATLGDSVTSPELEQARAEFEAALAAATPDEKMELAILIEANPLLFEPVPPVWPAASAEAGRVAFANEFGEAETPEERLEQYRKWLVQALTRPTLESAYWQARREGQSAIRALGTAMVRWSNLGRIWEIGSETVNMTRDVLDLGTEQLAIEFTPSWAMSPMSGDVLFSRSGDPVAFASAQESERFRVNQYSPYDIYLEGLYQSFTLANLTEDVPGVANILLPGIRRIYDVASALGLESLVDHFFPVNALTEVRVVHGEYLTFESETEGVTIETELLEEPSGYVRIRFVGAVEDSVVTQVKLTYAPGDVESFAVDFPATVLEQAYYPARESTVSGEWIPLYFPHGTDPGAPHLVDVSYQCTNSTPAEWECVNGYYTAHRWRTESYEQPIWLPNPGLDVYVHIRLWHCYTMASTGDESCGQYDSYQFYVR